MDKPITLHYQVKTAQEYGGVVRKCIADLVVSTKDLPIFVEQNKVRAECPFLMSEIRLDDSHNCLHKSCPKNEGYTGPERV